MAKLYKILSEFPIREPILFDLVALNNDELIKLADTIIKSDKYQKLISFYKTNKINVDLNIQKFTNTAEYNGIFFHDNIKSKYYVNVLRNNYILDITTIVHEFFNLTISYYISNYYPNIFFIKYHILLNYKDFLLIF